MVIYNCSFAKPCIAVVNLLHKPHIQAILTKLQKQNLLNQHHGVCVCVFEYAHVGMPAYMCIFFLHSLIQLDINCEISKYFAVFGYHVTKEQLL